VFLSIGLRKIKEVILSHINILALGSPLPKSGPKRYGFFGALFRVLSSHYFRGLSNAYKPS
jgi:hypothetical protein